MELTYGDIEPSGDIVLPETVTSLQGVTYTVVRIGSWAFQSCPLTGALAIPNTVTEIGCCSFQNCDFTGTLTLPEPLTVIDEMAFDNCGFTGELVLPNTIRRIGESAFSDCFYFSGQLLLPDSLTEIEKSVFENCFGFSGPLTIPASVKQIRSSAFENCSGFSGELFLNDSLVKIYGNAFANCTGFTGGLQFGAFLEEIDKNAFENCHGFSGDLTFGGRIDEIQKEAFLNCSGFNGVLTFGHCVDNIGNKAFAGCSFSEIRFLSRYSPNISPDAFAGMDGAPCYLPCNARMDTYEMSLGDFFANAIHGDYISGTMSVDVFNGEGGNVVVVQEPNCENGAIAMIKAIPDGNYLFDCWKNLADGDFQLVSCNPEHSFEVITDYELYAFFSPIAGSNEHTVTNVRIYPNPAVGSFTIRGNGLATIQNSIGQRVYETKLDGECRVSLPVGMYFVQVDGGVPQKIVVE